MNEMTEQEKQIWNAAYGVAFVMYGYAAVMAADESVLEFRRKRANNPNIGASVIERARPSAEHSLTRMGLEGDSPVERRRDSQQIDPG